MAKPLLHTMMIIVMITWTATQQLPLQCDSFTVLLKHRKYSHTTFSRLRAVVPPMPPEKSRKLRGSSSRKDTAKNTSTRRPSETTISATVIEALTEREMKQSMLSTKKRDKNRKQLSQQDYQLERSMLSHDLLSKEHEYELVYLYHNARELQIQINNILQQKQKQQQKQQLDIENAIHRENFVLDELGMSDFYDDEDETDSFDELYTSFLRTKRGKKQRKTKGTFMNTYSDYLEYQQLEQPGNNNDEYYVEASFTKTVPSKRQVLLERLDQTSRATMATLRLDPLTSEAAIPTKDVINYTIKMENTGDDNDFDAFMEAEFNLDNVTTLNTKWNDGDQRSSSFSTTNLSDNDIVELLNIPGGRKEMEYILLIGAQARDTLIRSNFRLVSSICKKWARLSNSNGRSSGSTPESIAPDSFYSIYSGGWNRPSLSEAIQEGAIGLTTAVDRFDPSRGLRLSTYATFWITNSVRQCFQRFSTGCLKLPTTYYDIRTRFKTLVRQHYDMDGFVPSFEVLAAEMGLSESRLKTVLSLTKPLLSVDGLLIPGTSMTQAGKSGNTNRIEDSLSLADTLAESTKYDGIEFGNPMDRVELSFLRQQLEHAMAIELVPFERDVLRLRLGLDDGVARTCREVALVCGGRLKSSEIRTIENRALKKLRSPMALATYKLLTFLDFADVDIKTISLT